MNNFAGRPLLVLFSICLMLPFGCGGGTSGSGLKTYKGSIDDTSSRALAGVSVTIESTGDNTTTNQNGEFSIHSDASGAEVPFLIESSDFISRFILRKIPEESAHISVSVTVDTETDIATVNQVNVRAGFVGLCDRFFENSRRIRQANHVPEGTACTLKVRVLGDGAPLAHLPIALEYNSCEESTPWIPLAQTVTGTGEDQGKAKFTFPFHDSETYCRYRVVAPYNSKAHVPVYYPIDTFTEQRKHPRSTPRESGGE